MHHSGIFKRWVENRYKKASAAKRIFIDIVELKPSNIVASSERVLTVQLHGESHPSPLSSIVFYAFSLTRNECMGTMEHPAPEGNLFPKELHKMLDLCLRTNMDPMTIPEPNFVLEKLVLVGQPWVKWYPKTLRAPVSLTKPLAEEQQWPDCLSW